MSSETKHAWAKGPWRTHIADSTLIVDAEGNEIASTLGDYDTEYEAMETRATFIAASPALYEATLILRQHLALFCGPDDEIANTIFRVADAALTAARGETA